MAGHSHWAGIKHKKGALDKKRGKLFSKLAKAIIISVKDGGGSTDLNANLKLRYAVDKAKEGNMPRANIERAIRRGSGVLSGDTTFSEVTYEGYGPGGVAVMVEIVTDNRNRTAYEMRQIFEKNHGKIGESGCVSYMFDKKGIISVLVASIEEDKLMELALDAGAEDIITEDDCYEICTDPGNLTAIKDSLEAAGIKVEGAEVTTVPKNTIGLGEEDGAKVVDLLVALEEYDDAENVYTNYEYPEEMDKSE